MPGKVVRLARRERLDWRERLYLPMIASALGVATRVLARNLWAYARGRDFRPHRYPERPLAPTAGFRGQPVLLAHPDGQPRCTSCGRCVGVCPPSCIELEAASDAPSPPSRFQLDLGRCMFCGLCEDVCPEDAIAMGGEFELARARADALRLELGELLREAPGSGPPGEGRA